VGLDQIVVAQPIAAGDEHGSDASEAEGA
jgi:hypothetical protein